jgi:hypothetical protein
MKMFFLARNPTPIDVKHHVRNGVNYGLKKKVYICITRGGSVVEWSSALSFVLRVRCSNPGAGEEQITFFESSSFRAFTRGRFKTWISDLRGP